MEEGHIILKGDGHHKGKKGGKVGDNTRQCSNGGGLEKGTHHVTKGKWQLVIEYKSKVNGCLTKT